MTFSLGEIRAMALKATRGAGYPWGLAEEAGQATTWLCAHALPGCEALAALLARNLAAELSAHSPRGPEWDAPRDLCPLITGAALCDNATRLTRGPLLLPPVAEPLLLLPFLALVSADTGQPLAMVTDGFHARTDGDALETEGKLPRHACDIVLRRDDPPGVVNAGMPLVP